MVVKQKANKEIKMKIVSSNVRSFVSLFILNFEYVVFFCIYFRAVSKWNTTDRIIVLISYPFDKAE